MDFSYTVRTDKTFDEAVEAVERGIDDAGFRVLYVHDVQRTFADKGFEHGPLKIIEACNAKYAHAVLEADIGIALMLPCPISVYEKDGSVWISTMKPTAIATFYPDAGIEREADEVERIVMGVVDSAAG